MYPINNKRTVFNLLVKRNFLILKSNNKRNTNAEMKDPLLLKRKRGKNILLEITR
jgi:hypothetical protein